MKKKELVTLLKTVLAALVEAETPPPKPQPTPAPPPAAGHRAYITADHQMCCQKHDAEFERHCRRVDGGIRFVPWR